MQSEIPGGLSDDKWKAMLAIGDTNKDGKISIDEYKAEIGKQQATKGGGAGGAEGAGGAGGASSLTVTTVLLGLVSTMWLFW